MSPRKMALLSILTMLSFTMLLAQQPTVKKTPAPPTSAGSGHDMFIAYCASCHGRDAKGDGPAAAALKARPADLTMLSRRNKGTFPFAHVAAVLNGKEEMAAHGSSDMPVWGPILRRLGQGDEAQVQQRINNLSLYLESLQSK